MTNPDDLQRYEQTLIDAEDALHRAICAAPTESERRILLSEYHTIVMVRYSRFPATWDESDDEPDSFAEGGDADGD